MHRCSIIACARWENDYIREWLAYNAAIGFDHVYLHCNDDDPSLLLGEVQAFQQSRPGFVTFKHYPGQGRQRSMYLDALQTALGATEWLTFLDIDEFLALRGVDDVNAFVAARQANADSISFHWLNFGNSGFVERPPGPVLANYTRRAQSVHPNTKHLTRAAKLDPVRLQASDYPFWHALSGALWSDLRRVDALGSPLTEEAPDRVRSDSWIATATIHHYMLKSEADFLRRAARGTGGEFHGQAMWQREYESGNYRAILEGLNSVEDRYLATFGSQRPTAGQGVAMSLSPEITPIPPLPPMRTVRVRHRLWTDDLVLGSNNRVRHHSHGDLGTYIAADDVLHVKWDSWPGDLFFEREGVFVGKDLVAEPQINLRTKQNVAFGSWQVEVRGILVEVPEADYLVEIRPETSDGDVFAAVFHQKEYDVPGLAGPIRTIVDLGANTGLAAVFFALRYPMARVVAVEPELSNYQWMCRNTRSLVQVQPVNAAIWSDDTTLSLPTTDAAGFKIADWAFQTTNTPAGPNAQRVPGLAMSSLLQRCDISSIDLLKIDIEGAEYELFGTGAAQWLPLVSNILVETHERFRQGSDARVTDALFSDFEERPMSGENRVFVRRQSA